MKLFHKCKKCQPSEDTNRKEHTSLSKLKEAINRFSYQENYEKPFTLASGKRSPYYFDLKQTLFQPQYLRLACNLFWSKILKTTGCPQALAGLTMGADPLIYGICLLQSTLPLIVRKSTKEHGSLRTIEGRLSQLTSGQSVVLIDDVVTTGGSTVKAYEAIADAGFSPRFAFCVVDRLEGGTELLAEHGVQLKALLSTEDFKSS